MKVLAAGCSEGKYLENPNPYFKNKQANQFLSSASREARSADLPSSHVSSYVITIKICSTLYVLFCEQQKQECRHHSEMDWFLWRVNWEKQTSGFDPSYVSRLHNHPKLRLISSNRDTASRTQNSSPWRRNKPAAEKRRIQPFIWKLQESDGKHSLK